MHGLNLIQMRNSQMLFLFTSFVLISITDIVNKKLNQITRYKPIEKTGVKASIKIHEVEHLQIYLQHRIHFGIEFPHAQKVKFGLQELDDQGKNVTHGAGVCNRLHHCYLTNSFQYIAIEN
jgi:hypothetical protein